MTVLLLDGRNALFRHSHANRLSTRAGLPTGGIYGMLTSLLARRAEVGASIVEVCWEGHTPRSWRHRLYPAYKARRRGRERDAVVDAVQRQEPWARDLLALCGVRQWAPVDGEGDDAIASRTRHWRLRHEVVVESGDHDLAQLVGEHDPETGLGGPVVLWKENRAWDADEVERRVGAAPSRVADLKALTGDTSDCYPGCPGVGAKGARGLLALAGSTGELLDLAAAGGVPGKQGALLVEHRELVLTCRRLAGLDADGSLRESPPCADAHELGEALEDLEFASMSGPRRLEALLGLGGT